MSTTHDDVAMAFATSLDKLRHANALRDDKDRELSSMLGALALALNRITFSTGTDPEALRQFARTALTDTGFLKNPDTTVEPDVPEGATLEELLKAYHRIEGERAAARAKAEQESNAFAVRTRALAERMVAFSPVKLGDKVRSGTYRNAPAYILVDAISAHPQRGDAVRYRVHGQVLKQDGTPGLKRDWTYA